jgi:hypothetical protein
MIILNKFIPKFNFIICLILNAALTVWRNQDAHPIGTAVNKLPECSRGGLVVTSTILAINFQHFDLTIVNSAMKTVAWCASIVRPNEGLSF